MTNPTAISARDLHEIEVLDCGDPQGLRYVVEAIATDPDDTTKVGSMFVCGCYNREVADMIANALRNLAARVKARQAKTTEPQPSYNQHPNYEEWKNICPNCRGRNTSHANNRQEEFNVLLRCLDCSFTFDLEQAFKAEHQRQLREKAGVA
jgi:hypothetical protein